MLVRLALESDTDAIIEMSRENCEISTPHLTFSEAKVRETVGYYLDTADPTIFVCEHDREVVGMLVATINGYRQADGLFTTQEVLFTRRDKHGPRAAVLLMKHLVAWSQQLGAIEITGGNDNGFKSERTAAFLEHFGFERVGYSMRRKLV